MADLTIYKASAGAGKTFQLTSEYLQLIFSPNTNFSSILAVTFTNKATGEMRERILNQLFVLAQGNKSEYANDLKQKFDLNNKQLKDQASLKLKQILYNYSRFNVSTIDSFFQRIIKSFAHEIGLSTGFNVELNLQQVLEEVISLFFDNMADNKKKQSWLTAYSLSKMEKGMSWDIQKDLLKFSLNTFNESFFALSDLMTDKFKDFSVFESYQQQLKAIINDFVSQVNALGAKAESVIQSYGLSVDDFSGKTRGIAAFMLRYRDALATKIEPLNKTALKALNTSDGIEGWVAKNSPKKDKVQACVNGGLLSVLQDLNQFFEQQYVSFSTAQAIANNLNTFALVAEIFNQVNLYCSEKNIFLLPLASPFLAKMISEDDAPFVYEKTGEYFKHFMVDEFQDTSGMQWKNFSPLFLNSISQGHRSLVVGDIKQSIYRWRNSDWQLLDKKVKQDFKYFDIEECNLPFNWRSHKDVVEFNNWCFEKIGQVANDLFVNEIPESKQEDVDSEVFRRIYSGAKQKVPNKNLETRGFVSIKYFDKESDELKDDALLNDMVQQILALSDKGYQPRDIAILVRKNGEGAQVAKYLMDYRIANPEYEVPLQFVSSDSVFLESSLIVRFIMSLLEFINDPNDILFKARVLYFYSSIFNSEQDANNQLLAKDIKELDSFLACFPSEFSEFWNSHSHFTLSETVHELLRIFIYNSAQAIKILSKESSFIHALQDAVLNFTRNQSADRSAFIEWWNDNGARTPICLSDEQNAIRILTIHKSKGLEYKAVFVPFANWSLDQREKIVWCKTQEPFNDFSVVPVTYSKKMANTHFSNEYYNEKMLSYVDNINLLYVAFTRAKKALFIYSNTKTNAKSITNVGALLYNIIENNNELEFTSDNNLDFTNYTLGELQKESDYDSSEDKTQQHISNIDLDFKKNIGLRLHGADFYIKDENSGNEELNRGRLLHKIFEDIITITDVEPAVLNMVSLGVINKTEAKEFISLLNKALANKNVKTWFSEKYSVLTEPVLMLEGGETKRPDRVMFGADEIVVVDYKFTAKPSSKHNYQVKEYVEIISEIETLPVVGYVWYILTDSLVRV